MHSAEEFKKTVSATAEDFELKGPFSASVSVAEALAFISQTRQQLAELKLKETNLRRGLNIFKIDQPPSHIILNLEKVPTCI